MTEDTTGDITKRFYDILGSVRALEKMAIEYDDPTKQDENLKEIKNVAYKEMSVRGVKGLPDSADGLDYGEARDFVLSDRGMRGDLYRRATSFAKTNLGRIVTEADSEGIERLLIEKDLMKYAPNGYEEWIGKYSSHIQMADFAERANRGGLKSDEEKALRSEIAGRESMKIKKKLKEEGASIEMQDKYASYAARVVLNSADRGTLRLYAEGRAKELYQELKDYEKENEKNAKTLVEGAIKRMLNESREVSRKALSYLEMVKPKKGSRKASP